MPAADVSVTDQSARRRLFVFSLRLVNSENLQSGFRDLSALNDHGDDGHLTLALHDGRTEQSRRRLASFHFHHLHRDDFEASPLELGNDFTDSFALNRVRPNHNNGDLIRARTLVVLARRSDSGLNLRHLFFLNWSYLRLLNFDLLCGG